MEFVKEIKCPYCGSVDIITGITLNSFAKRHEETFGHCYQCQTELKFSYEATRYDIVNQDTMFLEHSLIAMAYPDRFRTETRSYDPVTGEYEIAVSEYNVTSIVPIGDYYPDKN